MILEMSLSEIVLSICDFINKEVFEDKPGRVHISFQISGIIHNCIIMAKDTSIEFSKVRKFSQMVSAKAIQTFHIVSNSETFDQMCEYTLNFSCLTKKWRIEMKKLHCEANLNNCALFVIPIRMYKQRMKNDLRKCLRTKFSTSILEIEFDVDSKLTAEIDNTCKTMSAHIGDILVFTKNCVFKETCLEYLRADNTNAAVKAIETKLSHLCKNY